MREIPLTQGKVAIVDDEDYEAMAKHKWCLYDNRRGHQYAVRFTRVPKKRLVRMHRVILGEPEELVVDHINGDGLDNRRQNLRVCTRTENIRNSKSQGGAVPQFKGVTRAPNGGFRAMIMANRRSEALGTFNTAEDAARAYDAAAIRLHGDFARLNFPLARTGEVVAPRYIKPGAHNRSKTHCPAGHPYDDTSRTLRGHRRCRACAREYARRKRQEAIV